MIPIGYLSLQHSDGERVYARHLPSRSRRNLGKLSSTFLLQNAFHKQFSYQSKSMEDRSGDFKSRLIPVC